MLNFLHLIFNCSLTYASILLSRALELAQLCPFWIAESAAWPARLAFEEHQKETSAIPVPTVPCSGRAQVWRAPSSRI